MLESDIGRVWLSQQLVILILVPGHITLNLASFLKVGTFESSSSFLKHAEHLRVVKAKLKICDLSIFSADASLLDKLIFDYS